MSTVSSWSEACAHLVAAHPGATRQGEDAVRFSVRLDADGLTAHSVEVRRLEVGGAPWIEIFGVIGSLRPAWQLGLLQRNGSGALGVRCVRDGELAFRQTLPLTGLSPATLDEVVLAIAYHCADERRRFHDAESTR